MGPLSPEEKQKWLAGEKVVAEAEKAQAQAAKELAGGLTEEEIEAGLERARHGRKSGNYKDPDTSSPKKIAA
ncbi:MAG: hypothetical protein UY51_C0005G0635 [Candidatus Jorgensenbacteria bacterium GW2011_GWB1_49_9]|nr:MAG: hypothetical protein UY51_C0005G0635 [Candidatus Jorgensenbacteria bacterium GW2011_GWB1_49_9]